MLDATGSYLAPFGFLIFVTPWAAALQIPATSSAIKAAIGHEFWVGFDLLLHFMLLILAVREFILTSIF
jgi:hypothetical protein